MTTDHAKVRRAKELKAQGLALADIGRIIGASRATAYRYLEIGLDNMARQDLDGLSACRRRVRAREASGYWAEPGGKYWC